MKTIERAIKSRVVDALVPSKVALIFGARRVGKTVLLREIVREFSGKTLLLNGEDYTAQTILENRSIENYRHFLSETELLAIDEAQNVADVGKVLKLIVDEMPEIRVLATGSSSFDLQNSVGEPLVGRGKQFLLSPLSRREFAGTETAFETQQNLESRLIFGSYPELISLENFEAKEDYLRDVVSAYLLKDILAFDGVKNSRKMRDLLRLLAFQVGSEVSCEELGKQLGMNKASVEKYLDLLEKVFVIFRLGAFSRNLRKEISKSAKYYFCDNGVRNAIIGNFSPLAVRDDAGKLWENYLISERRKTNFNENLHKDFYFWRTYDKQEIDLIEERAGELSALEFKWGNNKSVPAPKAFREAYPVANFQVINPQNYLDFV